MDYPDNRYRHQPPATIHVPPKKGADFHRRSHPASDWADYTAHENAPIVKKIAALSDQVTLRRLLVRSGP